MLVMFFYFCKDCDYNEFYDVYYIYWFFMMFIVILYFFFCIDGVEYKINFVFVVCYWEDYIMVFGLLFG